jgi:hypothetical protein
MFATMPATLGAVSWARGNGCVTSIADDHCPSFADDAKLEGLNCLVNASSLEVEFQGYIAKILFLTFPLYEFPAHNADCMNTRHIVKELRMY